MHHPFTMSMSHDFDIWRQYIIILWRSSHHMSRNISSISIQNLAHLISPISMATMASSKQHQQKKTASRSIPLDQGAHPKSLVSHSVGSAECMTPHHLNRCCHWSCRWPYYLTIWWSMTMLAKGWGMKWAFRGMNVWSYMIIYDHICN